MKGETIGEVMDIGAMRQVVQAYDARQEILANGDRDLQAQDAQKAENAAIIQDQVNQIEANRQHLDELQTELARMRGELVAEDRKIELPWSAAWELSRDTKDVVHHVAGRLEGWAHVRDALFQPHSVRLMLQRYAQQLFQLHSRLIGRTPGMGADG